MGVELLGRHGTADISIEEIARAAGVSKGLLYHYFPTKNDFLVAVLARSQAEMDQELVRDPGLSPMEQFDRNLDGFLASSTATPRATSPWSTRAVASRACSSSSRSAGGAGSTSWSALAAVLADVPRDAVRTPLLVAAIEGWIGFTEGVTVRWLRDREISREHVHELLRRALLEVFGTVLPSISDASR